MNWCASPASLPSSSAAANSSASVGATSVPSSFARPFMSSPPNPSRILSGPALTTPASAGPERILDGLGGELMKGLAKELGTEVAPTDAELFAAALDDGSDAGEAHQFIGRLPATAIGAKGGGQLSGMDRRRSQR